MTPTVIAAIAAIFGPIIAFLAAARRFSGKIETSDAKELWAEAGAIRTWSMQRIEMQNQRIEQLENRVNLLETNNQDLLVENRSLLGELGKLKQTIVKLRKEIAACKTQLTKSRARIIQLEQETPGARPQ